MQRRPLSATTPPCGQIQCIINTATLVKTWVTVRLLEISLFAGFIKMLKDTRPVYI